MAIVSKPVADITPRDELIATLGEMIYHAVTSAEEVSPWGLASELIATVEECLQEAQRVAFNNSHSAACEIMLRYAANASEWDVTASGDDAIGTYMEAFQKAWAGE